MLLHPLERDDLVVDPAHQAVALLKLLGSPETRNAEPIIYRNDNDIVGSCHRRAVVHRARATFHRTPMNPEHYRQLPVNGSAGGLEHVQIQAALSPDLAVGLHTHATELAGRVVEAARVEGQPATRTVPVGAQCEHSTVCTGSPDCCAHFGDCPASRRSRVLDTLPDVHVLLRFKGGHCKCCEQPRGDGNHLEHARSLFESLVYASARVEDLEGGRGTARAESCSIALNT